MSEIKKRVFLRFSVNLHDFNSLGVERKNLLASQKRDQAVRLFGLKTDSNM